MNKARKQFILYAMLSVFILLTLLLGVLNAVNFTMVAEDADKITEMLSQGGGEFTENMDGLGMGGQSQNDQMQMQGDPSQSGQGNQGGFQDGGRIGPMGLNSPEISESIRHFTVAFDDSGSAEVIAYKMSAVSEEEAVEWARSLLDRQTGWTKTTYRFRVYEQDGKTYVTVIDQGRELTPSYRILVISAVGEVIMLGISTWFLIYISRKLFKPLEEADRKQRRFIQDVEQEFKVPLTVLNADTELIEKEHGVSKTTESIRRQVRKMSALVKRLSSLTFYEEASQTRTEVDLSALLKEEIEKQRKNIEDAGMDLQLDIQDGLTMTCGKEAIRQVFAEMTGNVAVYGKDHAAISMKKNDERITVSFSNGTELPDQNAEGVFDRFVRLDNAKDLPGDGLGLSYVREIVRNHDGRCSARIEGGVFTATVNF